MTHLIDIITPNRIVYQSKAISKNEVIKQISTLFANSSSNRLNANQLFDAFIAREHLGSTALGHGVAIPHIRSDIATQPMGALIQLHKSVDFDALDHFPVDIIFSLVVPAHQDNLHLTLLAEASQLLASEEFRYQVRQADSPLELFDLLNHPHHHADCA